MERTVEDKHFEKTDFKKSPLQKGIYENCIFSNSDLSSSDLSEIRFIDCRFTACNLSLANLSKTVFRDIEFWDCKMLGLRFDTCDPFGLSFRFEGCILNHSTFFGLKIKKTLFRKSQLQEVDLTDTDLSSAVFDQCDLQSAKFENTILEKADLSSAFNFTIDPETNRLKKARFSLLGLPGLLDKYEIEVDKNF